MSAHRQMLDVLGLSGFLKWKSALFVLALGVGFVGQANASEERSRSNEAFWIWPHARLSEVDSEGRTIYVLQGHLRRMRSGAIGVTPQGPGPRRLKSTRVWLVYRLSTQDGVEELLRASLSRARLWKQFGVTIEGFQLDYDAPTAKIGTYAEFLRRLRQRIPDDFKLSVTGLADWSTTGRASDLKQLTTTVDEVVVQLYQGSKPVAHLEKYARGLARLQQPFKIGLLPTMQLDSASLKAIAVSPFFQGSVTFVLPPQTSMR